MAERKGPARRKRGDVVTDPEKRANRAAAGRANLEAGRKAREEQRKRAQDEDRTTAGERWQMLLDGRLTVHDLDDEEVSNMTVRQKDGALARKRKMIPSHLAQQFHREIINRAESKFRTALGDAVKVLAEIATDPDASDAVRVQAADKIINRVMGKPVETVRIEGESKWDGLLGEALDVDRELADLADQDE